MVTEGVQSEPYVHSESGARPASDSASHQVAGCSAGRPAESSHSVRDLSIRLDLERPRLRGVFHQYAFFAAVAAARTRPPRGLGAGASDGIYAVALAAMFGVSALYHRITWRSLRVRKWMRRLDHSTIVLLIAGTYTPFALLVFEGRSRMRS